MTEILIIKKYPNRRLYNTETSSYITLEDIRDLVMKHIRFKVIEARSGEDMTSYVLLQIISEEEAGKFPLFTTELLQNIIRFYGTPLQKFFTNYLEQSMSMFTKQYGTGANPLNTMAETVKQNMEMWQGKMADFFQQNMPGSPKYEQPSRPKPSSRKNKSK